MMWIQPVDTLDLVVRGLIVGVVASAPMGPVGVLCVQRTLNKGRWYGFVTGVGAAVSDIIYALATGLGMSFALDLVENPSVMRWLQIVSSALLFVFGLHIYHSNPEGRLRPASKRKGSLLRNGFTGFALTISNPLIIVLFLVLFARFKFIVPGYPVEQAIGYVALLCGALLWWLGLTAGINKVRAQFDLGALKWINRIIGIVVMVVSLLAFYLTLRGRSLY
ncbi:MAG: LysE family transporter [Prevotellaceae bacterium]|nr:LysE family transporter [Prevotellaceae bacterium]MCD8304658.1 LysE family transporter [Prevotellaceae bacterium]